VNGADHAAAVFTDRTRDRTITDTCGITNRSCDREDNGATYDSIANVFEVASGVSRIYRINNTGQYANSVERDAHFIATNYFASQGYKSKTASGYPFSCLESYCNTSSWVEQLAHP
jgi:hypothetical protein